MFIITSSIVRNLSKIPIAFLKKLVYDKRNCRQSTQLEAADEQKGTEKSGKSAGGPAKTAIISGCLFGSVSGSAVANVAGTGVVTIPLMKETGYKPEFAGAVEAVASTGGQIVPSIRESV